MAGFRVDEIGPFVSSAEAAARLRQQQQRVLKRTSRDTHHDAEPEDDPDQHEDADAAPPDTGAYDDHGRLGSVITANTTQDGRDGRQDEPPATPHVNVVV